MHPAVISGIDTAAISTKHTHVAGHTEFIVQRFTSLAIGLCLSRMGDAGQEETADGKYRFE
ncbi:hypothetical protein [Sulfuriflexus mobilis]|uniref:hypothetical protein n=1 Tax=Sulfuriflexus mobilis TaxID=1811807 RepID=UPI0015585E93|nr:hypothetical protein [Sulfuriflexus mobilis]